MSDTINVHHTPQELYAVLTETFDEHVVLRPDRETRWVSIGAGNTTLTFFAPTGEGRVLSVSKNDSPQSKVIKAVAS